MDGQRVVEIWDESGKSAGTGYLVTDRLILTAFHNVEGAGRLEARRLLGEWVAAEIVWPQEPPDLKREPQADAALIRITDQSWVPPHGAPVRWGRIDHTAPMVSNEQLGFNAQGFPRSELRNEQRDTKQISGDIERLTGLKSGLITAYVNRVATPEKPSATSWWKGASGAALFSGPWLIGVIVGDRDRQYSANQLTAVSVASLVARSGFVETLGNEPLLETVVPRETPNSRMAYEVEAPHGLNNLPELPSRTFVGRDEALAALAEKLSADSRNTTQTIHGLGGVGKSTLALHYAHAHVASYSLVWWIRSDNADLIRTDLAALGHRIRGEQGDSETIHEAADWAIGWLQTHPGWLLVYDNAENPEDIRLVTGSLGSAGHHLVTSRFQHGWNSEPFELRMLDAEASANLLKLLTGSDDDAGIRALADELGHLPLALQQAGAYIRQRHLTVAEYHQLFNRRPDRLTATAPGGFDPARTMARIWRITLEILQERDPRAVELLRVLAWYAPVEIPRGLLEPFVEDLLDLDDILALLAGYHLITFGREAIGVHTLVQTVARTPATDDSQRLPELIAVARDTATDLIHRALPNDPEGDASEWPRWMALLPHAEALFRHASPESDSATTVRLLGKAGRFLGRQGRRRTALVLLERSVDSSGHALSAGDEDLSLLLRGYLADACRENGDRRRAVEVAESALADQERAHGEDAPSVIRARLTLAKAYASAGNYDRARGLARSAVEQRVRDVGEGHEETIRARNDLALILAQAEENGPAFAIVEENISRPEIQVEGDARAWQTRALLSRMSVMVSMRDVFRNLATFVTNGENGGGETGVAGAFREMSEIFVAVQSAATDGRGNAMVHAEQALAEARSARTAEHPDVLTAQIHLAHVCLMFGDVERASTLIHEVMPICERVLTEKSPMTVEARALMTLLDFDGDLERLGPLMMNLLAEAEFPLPLQQLLEDFYGRVDALQMKLSGFRFPDEGPVTD
ncbi:FxSxx-COOH system tetratricopeptide repeat protein [Streptomyces sp. NPDC048411]|uniref:FxSxx-COOH system tetratricopeptide repeat protein n=1 Tax=Streptomyces sp. NPDC048411 TaxID=3157206 RepID=UPI003454338D